MKTKSLPDRIAEIRAECDAFIDARVEVMRKEAEYQMPPDAIKAMITNRTPGCLCRAVLRETERAT